jgi:hypothetical protein
MLNNQEKYGYPITVYLLRKDYESMEAVRQMRKQNRTDFIRDAVARVLYASKYANDVVKP